MKSNQSIHEPSDCWGYLYNHKHICEALLQEGQNVAKLLFKQHVQALSDIIQYSASDVSEMACIMLNSLNRNLYTYIQMYLNISLNECCYMCRVHTHSVTDEASLIAAGEHIIDRYASILQKNTEKHHHFQRTCAYIQKHLEEDISIDQICSTLHISRSQLCRIFKALTGNTFCEYLKQQRLRKGRALLTSTDMTIEEISSKCGFQSSAYFSTVFKAEIGLTPSVFRKKFE